MSLALLISINQNKYQSKLQFNEKEEKLFAAHFGWIGDACD